MYKIYWNYNLTISMINYTTICKKWFQQLRSISTFRFYFFFNSKNYSSLKDDFTILFSSVLTKAQNCTNLLFHTLFSSFLFQQHKNLNWFRNYFPLITFISKVRKYYINVPFQILSSWFLIQQRVSEVSNNLSYKTFQEDSPMKRSLDEI